MLILIDDAGNQISNWQQQDFISLRCETEMGERKKRYKAKIREVRKYTINH